MDRPNNTSSSRSSMLSVFLGGFVALLTLTFLILIPGGFFLYVVLVVGAITFMGWLHYIVWGKLMMERTAGEREEMELLDRIRGDEIEARRGLHS